MQNHLYPTSQQPSIPQTQLQQAQISPSQPQQSLYPRYSSNPIQPQIFAHPGIPQQSLQPSEKDQKQIPQSQQGSLNAPLPIIPYNSSAHVYPFYPQQNVQLQSPNPQQSQPKQLDTNARQQYQYAQPTFYYPFPQYQPVVPQVPQGNGSEKIEDENINTKVIAQEDSERGTKSVSEKPTEKYEANAIQKKAKLNQPKWTKQDDARLLKLVKNTEGSWKKISKIINRTMITPLFLKNKYYELNPQKQQDIKKWVKYTVLEDLMVAKYAKVYGKDWGKIALHFANRDTSMVKNRYYSYVHRAENQGLLDQAIALEQQYGCILDNMICDDTGTIVIGPKPPSESDSAISGSLTVTSQNASSSEDQNKSKGQKSSDAAAVSNSSKDEKNIPVKKCLSNSDSAENSNSNNNNSNTISSKVENMIQEVSTQIFTTNDDWNSFKHSLTQKLNFFERNFKALEQEVISVKEMVEEQQLKKRNQDKIKRERSQKQMQIEKK